MSKATVKYPKIKSDNKQRFYVVFYSNEKRYRIYNGSKINSNLYPNTYPVNERYEIAKLLCAEVYKHLLSGLPLDSKVKVNMTNKDYLKIALEEKLKQNHTNKYKEQLFFIYKKLIYCIQDSNIEPQHIYQTLNEYTSESSYNTYKNRLNVLINKAITLGMDSNPMKDIKAKRCKAKLHKPYRDISAILDEVKDYNHNLYICCIMTYGCLLRPHREIRELTWSDFNSDLTQINLSGNRNKSGRNRIVPIPKYVSKLLTKGEPHHNIFTNTTTPPNKDYFNTLWGRFKRQSNILEQDQTLYSFRHSGAIEIFKRTGSITKLQKAMGHSSINVSLTYLRGLEIAELKEEDMPMV
ncbi:tyrosine-type recombinase/integrase [Winogradskyella sp.]|nr:tyrosine-type recombinase/integrase [Winogradskyella sp.]MDA8874405.1 tyrosine-type recombinase/integrase [Winogradskyella sp.]